MNESKYFVLFFSIILTLLSITTLIFSILLYQTHLDYSVIVEEIKNNHKRSIYSSVSDLKECRNSDDKFFNMYLEGTEHGCYCNSLNIYKGKCKHDDSKRGCYDLPEIKSRYLDIWRKTADLCLVKEEIPDENLFLSEYDTASNINAYISNYEYYLINFAQFHSSECPEGSRSCGYLDSFKNKLCFPKEKNVL